WPTFKLARALIDQGGHLEQPFTRAFGPEGLSRLEAGRARIDAKPILAAHEARARYAWVHALLEGVSRRPEHPHSPFTDRLDRVMNKAGLSGKSFIPMLSGFACAVPSIMATRTIENRRDRLATILALPLMSCSARLPVYTIMIGAFVPQATVAGMDLRGLVL